MHYLSRTFFRSFKFFCHVAYPFGFLLYSLGCHILHQNRSVSLASGCWYVFVSSPPFCWQNFLSLFWKSCFVCIILPFVDIFLIIIIIIIHSLELFTSAFGWWFFTGVRVTASLFKSPGLFSVFWPFSITLSFGWSPPIRQLPSSPVPLVIL